MDASPTRDGATGASSTSSCDFVFVNRLVFFVPFGLVIFFLMVLNVSFDTSYVWNTFRSGSSRLVTGPVLYRKVPPDRTWLVKSNRSTISALASPSLLMLKS